MIVELKNQDSYVHVLPDCGMNSIKIVLHGKSIMREIYGEEDAKVREPYLFGTPFLLPASRTAGGKFSLNGKTYELGINEPQYHNYLHGYLNLAKYKIISLSETEMHASYSNQGELFPFPFRSDVACCLVDGIYAIRVTLTNTGEEGMPVCFAVHTTFAAEKSFDVQIGKSYTRDENYIPIGHPHDLSAVETEYLRGASPGDRAISGCYTAAGHTAHIGDTTFKVSENFNHWVLYNQGGERGFICIEPQCGAPNSLNSGVGLLILPAGASETFTLELSR